MSTKTGTFEEKKMSYHKPKTYRPKQSGLSYKQVNLMIKKANITSKEAKENVIYLSDTITAGGSIALLNMVAEGSDVNQRIGHSIKHKHLQVTCTISLNSAAIAANQGDSGFIFVAIDSQTLGAAPAWQMIYDTTGVAAPAGVSLRNTAQYARRFKVLRKIDYTVSPGGPLQQKIEFYVDLSKLSKEFDITQFSSTTGNVTNCQKNAVVFGYGGLQQTVAYYPTIQWTSKYVYTDA
jgi:hypothetical protein